MITPNASSHWYGQDGSPAYDADLRAARKLGLAPSVTSIIGIIDKPAITAWKVNTMLDAAWATPRTYGILGEYSKDEWKENVEDTWQTETKKAAELGTSIHSYIERFLASDPDARFVDGYETQCRMIEDWLVDNIVGGTCEESFYSTIGQYRYGGRIDFYGLLKDGRRAVIDFKTQNLKGKKSPTYYDEWKWQLAAYKHYLDSSLQYKVDYVAMSVVIDTGVIDSIHSREYTSEEMATALDTFKAICGAYYAIKKL